MKKKEFEEELKKKKLLEIKKKARNIRPGRATKMDDSYDSLENFTIMDPKMID